MPDFVVSQADVTGSQMVQLVDNCQNITVGPNKYQLYCQTSSNLNGACTYLPSTYTSAGSLNCVTATSQAFLQHLYDTTGMACAINCYYPLSTTYPTINIPTFTFPSFTYSYPSYTYTTSSPSSTATGITGGGNSGGNSGGNTGGATDSGSGSNGNGANGNGLTGNTGNSGNSGSSNSNSGSGGNGIVGQPILPGIGGGVSASNTIDPNLMLTFMAVFAIMLLFVRKAI